MESVRRDQIVYRFYVKTLGVLADARLEFPAAVEDGKGQVRIDKWFNLPLPDHQLFRSELAPYRALSGTPSSSAGGSLHKDATNATTTTTTTTTGTPTIAPPPLLIAFTLDTSAIQHDERLYCRTRHGDNVVAVQLESGTRDRSREQQSKRKHGIVIERWTLRALPSSATTAANSVASASASSSYRAGCIHFRELFAYVETLPAHELVQRIRGQQGHDQRLGIGVKVWSVGEAAAAVDGPDGEGALEEAWEMMEDGLIPLHEPVTPLSASSRSRQRESTTIHRSFPPVTLGNAQFQLQVEARRDVDFFVDISSRDSSLGNSSISSSQNSSREEDEHRYQEEEPREEEEEEEEYFTPTIRHDASTPASPRRVSYLSANQIPRNPVHLANVQPVTAGLSATRPAGPLSSPRAHALKSHHHSEQPDTGNSTATATTTGAATRGGESSGEGRRRTIPEAHDRLQQPPPFAASSSSQGRGQTESSSGSFTTARYSGIQEQGDRVSSSPIPGAPIGRRYSGMGVTGGGAGGGGSEGGSGGSFTGPRYGTLQSDRVSSSPIPASQTGRRYSGLGGGGVEGGVRGSPLSTGGGIGLGISRTSSSGGGGATGAYYERPSSSYQRPSSYLSHSGRSFTQIGGGPIPAAAGGASYGASETSRPRLQSSLGAHAGMAASPGTPPFPGSGGSRPSSFSYSPSTAYLSNAAGRSSSTRAINHYVTETGTPPIPETHESGDDTDVPGGGGSGAAPAPGTSFGAGSRNLKRYSSSFGQQQQVLQQQRRGTPLGGGSTTSSGDPGSLMFAGSESRRTSARGSFDSMGMRRPSVTSLTRVHAPPTPEDADDIHAFLRTLDLLAHPTSSTSDGSDSLSASRPRSGAETGKEQPSSGNSSMYRKPLTKSQVDDALRRMAGSYTPLFPLPSTSGSGLSSRGPPVLRVPGAQPSLPSTTLDRPFGTPPQASLPRHSSSVKSSSPLAGEPIRGHRIRSSLDTTASRSESTSAASAASSAHDQIVEPLTFGKTRAGHVDKSSEDGGRAESRRGTVLMRGGFGQFDPPPSSRGHSSLGPAVSAPSIHSAKFQLQRRLTGEAGLEGSDRGKRQYGDGNTERVTAPILSAGAQPLDQGVRSWTHRRALGGEEDDSRLAARSALYTAPGSLESRQQRGLGSTGWPSECSSPHQAQPRRSGMPSTRRKTSDDGDDSIVGNLEMSGA